MSKAVICIIKTQLQVEAIVSRLRAAGLLTADISLVLLERTGILGLARDRDSHLDGGRAAAVQAPGPVGGVLGMLTGIGIVTIPGAGAHITAGPLAAAIAGTGTGAGIRGLADSLISTGCPMSRARQYEQLVRQGNILLAVNTLESDQVARATATLLEGRAEDILISDEATPVAQFLHADIAPGL